MDKWIEFIERTNEPNLFFAELQLELVELHLSGLVLRLELQNLLEVLQGLGHPLQGCPGAGPSVVGFHVRRI